MVGLALFQLERNGALFGVQGAVRSKTLDTADIVRDAWLRKLSWILVGSVIGANVGFKLFVALQLEVAHHFMERFAFRGTGGFEPPSTFGATKTLKTLPLNPYQLPAHGCLYRANEYQRAVIGIKDRSLHTPILMGLSGILHK